MARHTCHWVRWVSEEATLDLLGLPGAASGYTAGMADAAKKVATYQDVLAAPPDKVAEILDGELSLSPRPTARHSAAASALGEELGPPFKRGRGGPGGWIIVDEPELHLENDVLVPDLAGWRRERMPLLPDAPFLTVAPDWVCEFLSPGSARTDRKRKMPLYARSGVRNAWLIDPSERTLEVYRLVEDRWSLLVTFSDEECVRAEPFDAIELELGLLWADVEPPTAG
jgi:Uma2 family endonuclease